MVEIAFDLIKDVENRRKHGISLSAASTRFDRPILRQPDERADYGEERWLAVGWIEGGSSPPVTP